MRKITSKLNQFLTFILMLLLISCNDIKKSKVELHPGSIDLIQFVNPFVGTKNMGHTFPGASTPFGAVQLSPETNNIPMYVNGEYNPETYRYCSGYQ